MSSSLTLDDMLSLTFSMASSLTLDVVLFHTLDGGLSHTLDGGTAFLFAAKKHQEEDAFEPRAALCILNVKPRVHLAAILFTACHFGEPRRHP